MPRNKPRFNDLKDDLIKALKVGADPTTDQDPQLAKFAKWYLQPGNRTPRAEASVRKTGGITEVAIYPFSLPSSEDAIFKTTISKRTVTWLNSVTAVKAAANFITALATANKGKRVAKFYPAQAIFRETSTVADLETSKITGRKYRRQSAPADKGYVVPFGTNSTGTIAIAAAQAAMTAAKPAGMVLSFKPEEYSTSGETPAFAS